MNWKILNQPMGNSNLSGGYAPEKKPWLPIVMAALAAGSAIYGGIKSSQANNKAQRELEAEKAITQAERRRKYNENPLDRSDVQNLIRVAKQQVDKNYKKAEAEGAVMGATEANKQMAKDAGNRMMGEVVANIQASDAARKDAVDASYRAEEKGINHQLIGLEQQKGQNIANVASQVSSSLGSAAMSYAGAKMGVGSPAGGGVSPTTTQSTGGAALNSVGGGSMPVVTNEMRIAQYLKSMQGVNQNASLLYSDPALQRMIYERGGIRVGN